MKVECGTLQLPPDLKHVNKKVLEVRESDPCSWRSCTRALPSSASLLPPEPKNVVVLAFAYVLRTFFGVLDELRPLVNLTTVASSV